MEKQTKEEVLAILNEIQDFMFEEAETMWNDEQQDWGVLKLSVLDNFINKIRERHKIPIIGRGIMTGINRNPPYPEIK